MNIAGDYKTKNYPLFLLQKKYNCDKIFHERGVICKFRLYALIYI